MSPAEVSQIVAATHDLATVIAMGVFVLALIGASIVIAITTRK